MAKPNELILQQEGFKKLYKLLQKEKFVPSGDTKTVELIAPVFTLDPKHAMLNFPSRKTSADYVKKEIDWYESKDLSIVGHVDDVKIWNDVCSKTENKLVNSNYGWCIYSEENGSQYDNCLKKLAEDPTTRQALMIYQRPSMHVEWNDMGKHDFICTDGVQVMIRDRKLIYIVKQRSCDAIFGFFNDFAWHCHVYEKFFNDMKKQKINKAARKIKYGSIVYVPFSFHVYERHFELLEKLATEEIPKE